ncbi:MAG: peptidylprolyl isomerase [Gemmatimonadota bacterium]|nr:MAG: peptidylprolyl isomerase [Gemmatimonadota bacterium]
MLLVGSVTVSAGCEAFTTHSDLVARAAGYELTVDRLGEIVARGAHIPLQRDVVERMARLWVDYSLVAQRLADGDSLLDSATVVNALWAEAQQQIVTHYHSQLVDNHVVVTDEVVDSAYVAGEHRLIHHILIQTAADATPSETEAKLRQAEQLRQVAVSGADGWARANRENEDSVSREEGGSLGVIARGETVPPFEDAAFALGPGEVSPVVESDYGFHIVRRPPLAEVREEYEAQVRGILIERMNFGFINEIEARWEVAVRPDAPALMRKAAEDPVVARRSNRTLGTYLNGKFTVSDLAGWLQALPAQYTAEVINADDDRLLQFARGLIRNNVLEQEARDAGHGLTQEDFAFLRETLAQELVRVRQAMGLDSALVTVSPTLDLSQVVGSVVDSYMAAISGDLAQLAIVPPFLAEELRREMDWHISPSGVNRALERAARIRSGLTAGATPTLPADADSGLEEKS